MEWQMQDPAPRTPLQLEVNFRKSYAREESQGILRNISISGAFLEVAGADFTVQEKLQLDFRVGGRIRKVQALVVWKNSMGCGVKFLPLNNRDVQIVDDLIYYVESQRDDRRDVLNKIFKRVA